MKVTCQVNLDPYDFVHSSDYETMLFFIQAVDAFVADVGFTEDLMKMLVQSVDRAVKQIAEALGENVDEYILERMSNEQN